MRRRTANIFSVLLTCIFLNFVFSNTVFTHSHLSTSGRYVTHSHPYIPSGSGHSHTAISLDTIACFNLGVTSMKAGDSCMQIACTAICSMRLVCVCESSVEADKIAFDRRGPPSAAA